MGKAYKETLARAKQIDDSELACCKLFSYIVALIMITVVCHKLSLDGSGKVGGVDMGGSKIVVYTLNFLQIR